MKHYLLTWYGITDLKASLGIEASDGPILGTLKTGKFTDVVVLAYTNPNKDENGFTGDLYSEWKDMQAEPFEKRLAYPRQKAMQFVDALSNTERGHTFFTEWLKSELATKKIAVNIKIVQKKLRHLNDAEGIYDAAATALKIALDDAGEKSLTSFVSPGTPVMAYTWALIARANSQLNIEVISSSDPRKPPETIDLPKKLLIPLLVTSQSVKSSAFDVIIHLLGYERMPVYFGMLQFHAEEHIFITSKEFSTAARILSQMLPAGCRKKTIAIEDPFSPEDTRKAIEQQVADFSKETNIAANLTGGTKLMFAGALSACWEHRIEPFYFEIKSHNIIYIRDGSTVPFVGTKSTTDFFSVNGFSVIKQGKWEDNPCRNARFDMTEKLWEYRSSLGNLYRTPCFQAYNPPAGIKPNPPFNWVWGNSHAAFDREMSATLVLAGETVPVPNCDDFGQYLSGGWFEEYVFQLLYRLEKEGFIYDLRIGLEVNYSDQFPDRRNKSVGEFDCAFTDGKRLWLIECKAGQVKQEHIQKLENNLKTYGGIAAKGILVAASPVGNVQKRRIYSSTSIRVIQSGEVKSDSLLKIIF